MYASWRQQDDDNTAGQVYNSHFSGRQYTHPAPDGAQLPGFTEVVTTRGATCRSNYKTHDKTGAWPCIYDAVQVGIRRLLCVNTAAGGQHARWTSCCCWAQALQVTPIFIPTSQCPSTGHAYQFCRQQSFFFFLFLFCWGRVAHLHAVGGCASCRLSSRALTSPLVSEEQVNVNSPAGEGKAEGRGLQWTGQLSNHTHTATGC